MLVRLKSVAGISLYESFLLAGGLVLNKVADCFTLPVNVELDARGLRCPMPLLKTKQTMRDMAPAQLLRVLATDAGSVRDFRAYANLSGVELVNFEYRAGIYCYLLKKPPVTALQSAN